MNQNYNAIDVAKFLLSFLVVSIHISIFPSNKELSSFFTLCLARIAVPFFFICSGYLFFSRDNSQSVQALWRVMKRIGILFIGWTAVFMIILFFTKFIHEEDPFLALFHGSIRFFLLNPFVHLWYLPAVMIGVCIAWFFYKFGMIRLALFVASLLYIIGLFGDSYYGLLMKSDGFMRVYEAYYAEFSTMRNGVFFGFPFIVLSLIPNTKTQSTNAMLSIFFLILIIAEYNFVRVYQLAKDSNMYFSLPFFTYFFFHWVKGCKINISKYWSAFFREYSMGIYFIHMAYIFLLPESVKNYFVVILLSIFTIWVIKKVRVPVLKNLLR